MDSDLNGTSPSSSSTPWKRRQDNYALVAEGQEKKILIAEKQLELEEKREQWETRELEFRHEQLLASMTL